MVSCSPSVSEKKWHPPQYSRLENPMDGGAWWAAVHAVAKRRTRLSDFTFTFHFHSLEKEMATHSSVLAWRIPRMGEPGRLLSLGLHRVGQDWSDLAAAAAFPILLFSSISLHWSLRKAFLSLLAILWNSAFRWLYLSFSPLLFTSLLFTAICKASSDSHFAFLHFFFLGMVLIPVYCTMSQTFVHSSSGSLSIRSNLLNLFVTSTV